MRLRTLLPLAAAAMLAAPVRRARRRFAHVVTAGESLSSVAATDGLTVAQLAAANGLSSDAQLVAGSTLAIPPQSERLGRSSGTSALDVRAVRSMSTVGDGDGTATADDAAASSAASDDAHREFVRDLRRAAGRHPVGDRGERRHERGRLAAANGVDPNARAAVGHGA